MDLPIFQELILKRFEKEVLQKTFQDYQVGKVPTFTDLSDLEEKEFRSAVVNLELTFRQLNISPLFPYPFYIISSFTSRTSVIPLIRTAQELPPFFFCKNDKITNRESNMLNKVQIYRDKLANIDFVKKMEKLKELSQQNKKLYRLSKENAFYEEILTNIKER